MSNLKLEVISNETIKPSSPTPTHLRNYKFSLLDQSYPRIYMPVVLFYPVNDHLKSPCKQLKNSLAEILTHYYPLAGRMEDGGLSVDCNDEGVEFFETQTQCSLPDVLENADEELLNQFFPSGILWNHKSLNNMLYIQVCSFSCGGMAVGICMSHKFGDASSLISFLYDWGKLVKHPGKILSPPPQLISASVILPNDSIRIPEVNMDRSNSVRKRLVFNASKITDLRTKTAPRFEGSSRGPTRVEIVTAQLYKSAKRALQARSDSDSISPSVIIQNVNLRKRMVPPLPENVIGNLVSFFPVLDTNGISDDLHKLLEDMRGGLNKVCDRYANVSDPSMRTLAVLVSFKELHDICTGNKGVTTYKCTSWCKLPIYEVDFGWGKPIWFGIGRVEDKNTIVLTDTKEGDGVEAWVTLEEQVMAIFEQDEELLSVATFLI